MRYTGRNIAALARRKCSRFTIHRQRHRAVENDVRCFRVVRVLRVKHVRPILPHIRVFKSFALQLFCQLLFVHADNVTAFSERCSRHTIHDPRSSENGDALPAALGDAAERAYRLQERSSLYVLAKNFFSPKPFRELSLETKARYPEAEARESLRVERREICAPC